MEPWRDISTGRKIGRAAGTGMQGILWLWFLLPFLALAWLFWINR